MNAEVPGGTASTFCLSGLQQQQSATAISNSNMWKRRWTWSPKFLANEAFELLGRFGDLGNVVHCSKHRWEGTVQPSSIAKYAL